MKLLTHSATNSQQIAAISKYGTEGDLVDVGAPSELQEGHDSAAAGRQGSQQGNGHGDVHRVLSPRRLKRGQTAAQQQDAEHGRNQGRLAGIGVRRAEVGSQTQQSQRRRQAMVIFAM